MQPIQAIRSITTQEKITQSAKNSPTSILDFVIKCQNQLTTAQLIATYEECIQSLLNIDGVRYRYPLLAVTHVVGSPSQAQCNFQLKIEEEFWGDITIYKNHEISDSDLTNIELISSLLIHPLRTAIQQETSAFGEAPSVAENTLLVEQLVAREAKLSHREHVPMSIILFDIDRFHSITDRNDFIFKDQILYEVMEIMHSCIRDTDLIFRYCDNTYCLILKGVCVTDAHSISERVRKKIDSHHFQIDSCKQHITISSGIAGLIETDSIESIFSRALHAVQHAKKLGRNQSIIADGKFIG